MTVALPMAWTGIVLGGVAFLYTLFRDVIDGKRIDELSEALDVACEALDAAVVRISYLEDAARTPVKGSQRLQEPRTQPAGLPIPPRVTTERARTDTAPAEAVIDHGLHILSGATASGGRHRAR